VKAFTTIGSGWLRKFIIELVEEFAASQSFWSERDES
jgi:hypothetical protein